MRGLFFCLKLGGMSEHTHITVTWNRLNEDCRALALAMTGDKLPAAQAKEWSQVLRAVNEMENASMKVSQLLSSLSGG